MSIIDFHSHILPGIDDGSRSVKMSREILAEAMAQGTQIQVMTPHFYASVTDPETFLMNRNNAWRRLVAEFDTSHIRLMLGAEVAFSKGISEWESLDSLAIVGTNLILIEMPFRQWTSDEVREIDEISRRGLRPILAHLERFYNYQHDSGPMDELLSLNPIVQFNTEELLSFWGRGKLLRRMKEQEDFIIGTDCHNTTSRPYTLKQGRDIIAKNLGRDALSHLDEYGTLLLKG